MRREAFRGLDKIPTSSKEAPTPMSAVPLMAVNEK